MQIGTFLQGTTLVSAILTILLILLQQRGASLVSGHPAEPTTDRAEYRNIMTALYKRNGRIHANPKLKRTRRPEEVQA